MNRVGLVTGASLSAFISFANMAGANAQTGPAASPIVKVGTEFQANKIIKYSQVEPSVAGLTSGNFVVTWQDDSQTAPDVSSFTVRGRIFKPNGVAVSATDFILPNRYVLTQAQTQVIGLKTGGFVAAWADNGQNGGDQSGDSIRSRRFSNAGVAAAAQTTVNSITGGDQMEPALSQIPTGGYIAAWFDGCFCQGDSSYNIRGQVFSEAGARVGGGFRANKLAANPGDERTQEFPSVAGLTTGDSVVVWEDANYLSFAQDPDIGTVIRGQLVGKNGVLKGTNFLVNTTIRGNQHKPGVASIGDGRYVAVWEDNTAGAATPLYDTNIRGQVRNAAGNVGGEFVVNRTTAGQQRYPKVLGLPGRRFVSCWVDTGQNSPDTSGNGIRCQVFAMSGANAVKYGPEFIANTRKTNNQGNQFGFQGGFSLALLKNRDFVVVWEDWSGVAPDNQGAGIRGQVYRVN